MQGIIDNILSSQNFWIPILITVVSNIFFALAINYDTKLTHVKYGNLWTSAAFFFGAATVAIYYIFRRMLPEAVPIVCSKCGKKAKKNMKKCPHCGGTHFVPLQYENPGAVRNRIIVFLAIAVVLLAFNRWYTNYSPWAIDEDAQEEQYEDMIDEFLHDTFGVHYGYEVNGEFVYYDREGEAYTDAYEVQYYDKDKNIYVYDSSKGFVSEKGEISFEAALIDSNGYILDAYSQFETIPDILPFKTQDGTMYYSAEMVSWDKDGNMVYTSNGNQIN